MALQGSQIAQILYQAGFRGKDLVNFTGIARRESGWDPAAHRTDGDASALTGDMGLLQINAVNFDFLRTAGIIQNKSQLFDPLTNARAAYALFQNNGYSPWKASSGGFDKNGEALYGVNVGGAQEAVNQASSQGLLGTDFAGAGSPQSGSAGASTTGEAWDGGVFKLPPDARVVKAFGKTFALFEATPGIWMRYEITEGVDLTGVNVETLNEQGIKNLQRNKIIDAGDALELSTLSSSFPTFKAFWDSIMNTAFGLNNPARHDKGVIEVIAMATARGDMEKDEIENLLQVCQSLGPLILMELANMWDIPFPT